MRHAPFALLLLLAACDPIIGLDITVVVPPEAQADYAGAYPAQVAMATLGTDAGGEFTPQTVGILCASAPETRTFLEPFSYVGCADETEIRAWLVPIPADTEVDCTTDPPTATGLRIDPITEAPWASAVAFAGHHDDCASMKEAVTLTLKAP